MPSSEAHTWYLQPHIVIFSLFSQKLPIEEKDRLAVKLVQLEEDNQITDKFKLGKPDLKRIGEKLTSKTELVDLVDQTGTFKFFHISNISCEWNHPLEVK